MNLRRYELTTLCMYSLTHVRPTNLRPYEFTTQRMYDPVQKQERHLIETCQVDIFWPKPGPACDFITI